MVVFGNFGAEQAQTPRVPKVGKPCAPRFTNSSRIRGVALRETQHDSKIPLCWALSNPNLKIWLENVSELRSVLTPNSEK